MKKTGEWVDSYQSRLCALRVEQRVVPACTADATIHKAQKYVECAGFKMIGKSPDAVTMEDLEERFGANLQRCRNAFTKAVYSECGLMEEDDE